MWSDMIVMFIFSWISLLIFIACIKAYKKEIWYEQVAEQTGPFVKLLCAAQIFARFGM